MSVCQNRALVTEMFIDWDTFYLLIFIQYSSKHNKKNVNMDLSFGLEEPGKMNHQARLAQSVEHETLNLGVVGSSPTLGDLF